MWARRTYTTATVRQVHPRDFHFPDRLRISLDFAKHKEECEKFSINFQENVHSLLAVDQITYHLVALSNIRLDSKQLVGRARAAAFTLQ